MNALFASVPQRSIWIDLDKGKHAVIRFITETFRGTIAVPKEIYEKYKNKRYIKVKVFALKEDGSMEIYEDKIRIREHLCGTSGTCRVFNVSQVIWKNAKLIVVVI